MKYRVIYIYIVLALSLNQNVNVLDFVLITKDVQNDVIYSILWKICYEKSAKLKERNLHSDKYPADLLEDNFGF